MKLQDVCEDDGVAVWECCQDWCACFDGIMEGGLNLNYVLLVKDVVYCS